MNKFTKEDVLKLLKKQRENCHKNGKIIEYEYVNPYSDSDGDIHRSICLDSIMDAEIPDLDVCSKCNNSGSCYSESFERYVKCECRK